jgi:hypothetical protein
MRSSTSVVRRVSDPSACISCNIDVDLDDDTTEEVLVIIEEALDRGEVRERRLAEMEAR